MHLASGFLYRFCRIRALRFTTPYRPAVLGMPALLLAFLWCSPGWSNRCLAAEGTPKYRPVQPAAEPMIVGGGPEEDLAVFAPATYFEVPTAAHMMASPGTSIGETYYDYQHNSSTGRQVDEFAGTIQASYMRQSVPAISPGRKVYWNRVAVTGSPANHVLDNGQTIRRLPLGAPLTTLGSAVGPEDQQGFTTLRLTPNGRAAAFYHATGALGSWAAALDSASGSGVFTVNAAPQPGTIEDPVIWPHSAADIVGTDTVLHVVGRGSSNATSWHNTWYWRGVISSGTSTVTWSSPVMIADSMLSISAVVEADPMSDRVAIVYTRTIPFSDIYNVFYRLSTDGGLSWGAPVAVTSYTGSSSHAALPDVGSVFDFNGTLHVVYSTAAYDNPYVDLPVQLQHWNDQRMTSRSIQTAYWDNCSIVDSGYNTGSYRRRIALPSISVKPAGAGPGAGIPGEMLYAVWVQFGPTTTDCATQADGVTLRGLVNGEIWCSASSDDGLTWDRPRNLTGTTTPNCTPGTCHSEGWVTAAAVADSGVYLSYVDDTHAGGIVQNQGAWSLSPYKVLAVEAGAAATSPRQVMLPVNPPLWPWPVSTEGYSITLYAPPAGVQTHVTEISNPGTATLNYTATITDNGNGSNNPLVNGVPTFNGSIAPGDAPETLTVSFDAAGTQYNMDFKVDVTSNDSDWNPSLGGNTFTLEWQSGLSSGADTAWSSMDTVGYGDMQALTVHSGELFAGGFFPSYVKRWTGTTWSTVGAGLAGTVQSLASYGGKLYAGGYEPPRLSSWDGSAWSTISPAVNDRVFALAIFDGKLIVGGIFTSAGGVPGTAYIAAYNGTSWSALGTGMNDRVTALSVYDGQLVAGGWFTTAGGNSANAIAAWDGVSWTAMDSGITGAVPGYGSVAVEALAEFRGRLIAGGYFTAAGGQPASRIASWDGTTWETLGTGMSGGYEGFTPGFAPVHALAVHHNRLFAGGGFDTAGGVPSMYVAQWAGGTWSPLGSGALGTVQAFSEFNGKLIVGGSFGAAGNQANLDFVAAWAADTGCGTQDTDGDGVFDLCDNCVQIVNPGQEDSDGDFAGNVCDNCPSLANAHQTDTDNDNAGDACDGICPITITGDVNLSNNITSADVITLVNYVFKSGLPPQPCVAAGDVNCNGSVTSADVISLVNYVFKGGAPPCDGCTSTLASGC